VEEDAMNLNISGHHLDVTPPIRAYVESKLERVLRHFDHVIDVHVILSVQKLRQCAEVTLHTRGKDIFAQSEHDNLYAAIDSLIDKLDRAVMKHKDRAYGHPHDSMKNHHPGEAA
jgi:putative sigma-54 modulation protein